MTNPTILIATGNKGKFTEIANLLSEINLKSVGAFDYNLAEPEENGVDFAQNSLIKARYYAKNTNLIALADDSGLCIDLLDGYPGIHSARWAVDDRTGKKDFNLAFQRIVEKLKEKNIDISKDKVKANFVCNLTIFNPKNDKYYSFEGRVDGAITFPPRGINGFGYDPIFIANIFRQTFGEVTEIEKESISHRTQAFAQFKEFLNSEQSKSILF
jgi:XTP/dITP diphosphohydrolase